MKVGPFHAQHPGGSGNIPLALFERSKDVFAFGGLLGLAQIAAGPGAAGDPDFDWHGLGFESMSPWVRIAIRSTVLRSSRILPGQA